MGKNLHWLSSYLGNPNLLQLSTLCTSLFINVYIWWLNRSNSWKCSSGSRITRYILCCSSFSFCSFFRSCNCYLLWNNLQWRKDSCLEEFITFTLIYSLSLSFGFNTCWYSSNLFPNAFPRITPVEPPDVNINKKRSAKSAELVLSCNKLGFPRYELNQLKIFVPVGKDIKIVTPVK